jgi:hypothetical protein
MISCASSRRRGGGTTLESFEAAQHQRFARNDAGCNDRTREWTAPDFVNTAD